MKLLRVMVVIGVCLGAVLGLMWVLEIGSDAELRRTLGKTAGVLAILTGSALALFLVGGRSDGGR